MQVLIPALLCRAAASLPIFPLLPIQLVRILIHQLEPADVLPTRETVRQSPDPLIVHRELRQEGIADEVGSLFDEGKIAQTG